MSTVTVARVIDAPVVDVWRVFTDLAGRARWLSTVSRVEVLSTAPFGAGATWRETRTMADDSPVTEEFVVQECTPGSQFVVRSPGIGADYRMTYTFAPVTEGRHRGGTTVTVVQDGHPTAPAGRFLALILGGLAAEIAEGALRQDLDDLAAAA